MKIPFMIRSREYLSRWVLGCFVVWALPLTALAEDTAVEKRRGDLPRVLLGDPEIETSISQQEMAFRMQSSVPELTDLSEENKKVMESYGPG